MTEGEYEGPQVDETEADEGVGYGKPPVEHRFQKGVSGNPKGRPRGRRKDVTRGYGDGSLESLILREGERSVTVRDSGKVQEVPTIEVIVRSTMASAAKGDRYARKLALDLYQAAEKHREQLKMEIRGYVDTIQSNMERLGREYRRQYPNMGVYPSADDIWIDEDGWPVWKSPWLDVVGARIDDLCQKREDWQEEVIEIAARYHDEKCPADKAALVEEWRHAEGIFDELNGMLPSLPRTKLVDRMSPELRLISDPPKAIANVGEQADGITPRCAVLIAHLIGG